MFSNFSLSLNYFSEMFLLLYVLRTILSLDIVKSISSFIFTLEKAV